MCGAGTSGVYGRSRRTYDGYHMTIWLSDSILTLGYRCE